MTFYEFQSGVSSAHCSLTHHSIKQGLPTIFPFYSPQNGKSLDEYDQAHVLLGRDLKARYTAFCPLIYPTGHVFMNGNPENQHFILHSDYILQVCIYGMKV